LIPSKHNISASEIMNRISQYILSLLSMPLLLIGITGCTPASSADSAVTPPLAGAVKPKEPVLRRGPVKIDAKAPAPSAEVRADFDFQLLVNGKTPLGQQSLDCAIVKAEQGKLTLRGPKQEELVLGYRLDSLHPLLSLPAGVTQLQVDAKTEVLQGALTKQVTLSQQGKILHMALLVGGSIGPLQQNLAGGITIAQQPMDPRPQRSDAEASYHTVPVKVSGPGLNLMLRPGEQKSAGGLNVHVVESEQRVLNPSSRTAPAGAEGPAFHYQIAIYR
jgi:hypothetical protein